MKKNSKIRNLKIEIDTGDKKLDRLLRAVAAVEASFPAGDYHFNSKQNVAFNELTDSAFDYKNVNVTFKEEVDKNIKIYEAWLVKQMHDKGIITEDMMNQSIEERGLTDYV